MSDDKLQRSFSTTVKEKSQYFLAFVVIVSMLLVAEFPPFVVFFFGIFGFFMMKMFAGGSRTDTRDIFEFYLAANDILRDDDRIWYGFEVNGVIRRGESIVKRMSDAPPLVVFTLGALFHKIGDHSSAAHYLGRVIENESGTEDVYVYPSQELRNYVRVLRKIERAPGDAPLTAGAVRSLERARRNRGMKLLEESRISAAKAVPTVERERIAKQDEKFLESITDPANNVVDFDKAADAAHSPRSAASNDPAKRSAEKRSVAEERFANRKPITEVLHDIYDRNSGS